MAVVTGIIIVPTETCVFPSQSFMPDFVIFDDRTTFSRCENVLRKLCEAKLLRPLDLMTRFHWRPPDSARSQPVISTR
jgi:hypothetical protein